MLKKIISGGQTGADVAGLDVAIKHGVPYGGAIPKGQPTENGVLPKKYNLQELPTKSYPKGTKKNVVDADGTVIFTHGRLTGGSLLTRKKAVQHEKPVLHLDMNKVTVTGAADLLKVFVCEKEIDTLNVAGSRGSKDPDIYNKTFQVLEKSIMKPK